MMSISEATPRHASVASAPTVGEGSTGRRSRKPQEFLLPDGRKMFVALPEEAARLRDKYAHAADSPGATQVEIVIHGSEEHHEHLRHLHRHHSAAQETLRAKHGPDFELWERTRGDLDEVGRHLEGLSDRGAAEALSANFERFGYASVLRTYDDDTKGESTSGATPPRRKSDAESSVLEKDWDNTRGGRSIKLFQRPVIKQYFHRGLLWRASELTKIMSFELFFDLLYGEFNLVRAKDDGSILIMLQSVYLTSMASQPRSTLTGEDS